MKGAATVAARLAASRSLRILIVLERRHPDYALAAIEDHVPRVAKAGLDRLFRGSLAQHDGEPLDRAQALLVDGSGSKAAFRELNVLENRTNRIVSERAAFLESQSIVTPARRSFLHGMSERLRTHYLARLLHKTEVEGSFRRTPCSVQSNLQNTA